jgi:imidazolonepropionase-like amidohydrolase
MRLLSFLFALLVAPSAFGQAMGDPVAQGRRGAFAIVGARVYTMGPQGTIERGTVVIRDGRIEAVGAGIAVPAGAEVMDGTGLEVYPGLIDGGTGVGMQEVGSQPETIDRDDVGEIIPHLQALTAVNPNSVVIPVTRLNGVTTVIAEPVGGLFPGTAALVRMHGYTPEQMLVAPNARYVVLEFPRTGRRGGFDQRPEEEIQKAAQTAMKRLDDTWDAALQAVRMDSAAQRSPEAGRTRAYAPALDALGTVIRGERALMIRVDVASDIEKAIQWAQRRRVPRVILSGLQEGWRVADKIAASGYPAVVGPVLSVPTRGSDRYDRAYANAGMIAQAGGRVAIRTSEVENARNLPFHAGFAAAYGLGRDAALRAVTIDAARAFGVEDRIGSLEVGKAADVIVTTGDPFETRTEVRRVFIDGYDIPLVSRQTQLYREFLNRNPGYTGQ